MRTFKEAISGSTRACVLESVLGIAGTLAILALWGVPSLGMRVIDPHPVWLVALIMAARYGTQGLAVALPIAWGALGLLGGPGGFGRVLDTLASPIELGALTGTIVGAWIVWGNPR